MKLRSRRLRLESLEHRQVLSGTPLVDPVIVSNTNGNASIVSTNEDGDVTDELRIPNIRTGNINWTKVATADFTGDGVTDFLGQADGEWWLQVNDGTEFYYVEWGNQESSGEYIDVADINNDGRLDAVSVDRSTGDIWVLINEGNTATEEKWGQMDGITESSTIFVGDFSADGLDDVIVGNLGDAWTLAQNTGSELSNVRYSDFPQFEWQSVLAGDYNGDNVSDIAVRGADQTWWVWFGRDGGFDPAQFWGHWKARDVWHDVQAGDFNNDGKDDIIGRTEDGRLWVGTATDTRFHTWTWSKGWVNRADWSNVTLVDMDDDGLLDQVGKDKQDRWWFAHNVGDRFQNHFWLELSSFNNHEVVAKVQMDEAIDVIPALPTGGYDMRQQSVTVELSDDNKLTINGNARLIGLQFQSASSSLIPGTDADPFAGFLANTESQISVFNLGTTFDLNGTITLDIGWDTNGSDLDVVYGVTGTPEPFAAEVEDGLGPEVTPRVISAAEANDAYFFSSPF